LGIDDMFESILDVQVPRVRIPIRPGRNVSSIVEVATRNFLLKAQGHHAARQFQERLALHLSTQQETLQHK
jgi:HPr kinase/phosphorylase